MSGTLAGFPPPGTSHASDPGELMKSASTVHPKPAMKTSRPVALAAALIATGVSTPCALLAQSTNPSIPVGNITAFPLIVQPGTRPNLTWNITYPSVVQDFIDIEGVGTVVTTEELDVEVRVLGAGVTVSSNGSNNYSFVPTEAQISYDGGSYTRVFYGTNNDVKPSKIVYSKTMPAGKRLRFGGRYYYNKKWGPYYNSQSGTLNVRTLVNGQTPPTTYPLHTAPTLESFIKPYLDAQGKVKIGPMDVIVFMELTHTDSQKNDQGYDLQDMVLLATFKSKRGNNGHGNNVDGVDSSNPGNAPFVDSDPTVDDENR